MMKRKSSRLEGTSCGCGATARGEKLATPMVYPSGFAVATKVGPTVPDPPARFTMRSGWPRILAAASASTRVDRSEPPPAPSFTLTSISRSGTERKSEVGGKRGDIREERGGG